MIQKVVTKLGETNFWQGTFIIVPKSTHPNGQWASNPRSSGGGGEAKEVLQKESGRRLCHIYGRCKCMELFQRLVAPLVLKIGIHQG
jgi:hypothetical protein